jgi:hypothetical protein
VLFLLPKEIEAPECVPITPSQELRDPVETRNLPFGALD